MRKTRCIASLRRRSAKEGKAKTLYYWHPGGNHVTPGVVPYHITNILLLPFRLFTSPHILFLDKQVIAWPPHASSFIMSHDAIFFFFSPPNQSDPYLIALRSVTLPTHPPTEDYTRGEVLCAGFTIWEESSTITKVGQMRRAHSSEWTFYVTPRCGGSPHYTITDVFHSRSPTTTRPRRGFSPTSPQTLLASPPAFTALFQHVAISWRPTRTAPLLRRSLPRNEAEPPCFLTLLGEQ